MLVSMKCKLTSQRNDGSEHICPASLSLYWCPPSLKTESPQFQWVQEACTEQSLSCLFLRTRTCFVFHLTSKICIYDWRQYIPIGVYTAGQPDQYYFTYAISSWWEPMITTLLSLKPWSAEKGLQMSGKCDSHGPLEHPFITIHPEAELIHYYAKDKSPDRRSTSSSYFPFLSSPLI